MAERGRVPAVEGWFTMDERAPRLLGARCRDCGSVFFPKPTGSCRNPACGGEELEGAELSRRGILWSITDNRYPPPKPYVAPDPFEPYAIAAVELEQERMVVLGQIVRGVRSEDLRIGMPMELVLDTLYSDEANDYVVWKWRPVAA